MIRHGLFEIRESTHPGPAADRKAAVDMVVAALDDCHFPWHLAKDGLETRRTVGDGLPFPIEWEPNARAGARGYVSRRRMWLALHAPPETVAHELCHVADLACFSTSWFAGQMTDERAALMRMTTHNDPGDHPHSWSPRVPWHERPIEAITVPFTRAFFNNPIHYYPNRFSRIGHEWDDVDAVKEIFMAAGSEPFPDVDPDGTHAEAIFKLAEVGIFLGDEDGNANPRDYITREQEASMIYRALKFAGVMEG